MSFDPTGAREASQPTPTVPGDPATNLAPAPAGEHDCPERRAWHRWAESVKQGRHRPDWWIHHTIVSFR